MNIYLPWGLIAVVIVLRFTLKSNRQRREFNQSKRDELKQARNEYLSSTLRDNDIVKVDKIIAEKGESSI